MTPNGPLPRISYVVPAFNEAETIAEFHRRAAAVADGMPDREFEFLFIDDGSTDTTPALLDALAERDPRVRVLHLAQNRGHQIALTAGLDYATGDAIITIDADLQDAPELLGEILPKLEGGCDVVHMQRRSRAGEGWFKLLTARCFYVLLRRLSGVAIVPNCGDFRGFTRPVLEAVRGFRTPHRFLRGTFVQVGFRQCTLQFDRDARFAGETKYPFFKMLQLAIDAVLSFSAAPIRAITWMSLLLWGVSAIYICMALYEKFVLGITEAGWTSIVALLFFFSGLILASMAIIGAYVGRIFMETQRPPLYWLSGTRNVDWASAEERAAVSKEVRLSRRILDAQPGAKPETAPRKRKAAKKRGKKA